MCEELWVVSLWDGRCALAGTRKTVQKWRLVHVKQQPAMCKPRLQIVRPDAFFICAVCTLIFHAHLSFLLFFIAYHVVQKSWREACRRLFTFLSSSFINSACVITVLWFYNESSLSGTIHSSTHVSLVSLSRFQKITIWRLFCARRGSLVFPRINFFRLNVALCSCQRMTVSLDANKWMW